MKKKTISQHIIDYLQDKDWTSSTTLDKQVALIAKCKEATVSREARRLEQEGKIMNEMKSKVVWYRIHENEKRKKQIVNIINGIAHVTYI